MFSEHRRVSRAMIKYLKLPMKAFVFAETSVFSVGEPIMAENIVKLINTAFNSASVKRLNKPNECELIDIKLCRISNYVD